MKDLWVQYKRKRFRLGEIDFDKPNLLNLLIVAKYVASEDGFQFPKYPQFFYHPPQYPRIRFPIKCDQDLMKLVATWGKERHVEVLVGELKEPSELNKLTVTPEAKFLAKMQKLKEVIRMLYQVACRMLLCLILQSQKLVFLTL